MAMLSRDELNDLMHREATPASLVLSVYLDVDQSREVNVERGFEIALKDILREMGQELDEDERTEFAADAERVLGVVEGFDGQARSLVIFGDVSADFLWTRELSVRMPTRVRRGEAPHVRLLIEMFDEYERFGVVLADKAKARLFTVYLGEIEEHREVFAESEIRHISGTGRSANPQRLQRRADEHVHQHLKHVAGLMDNLVRANSFDRLVLAGPVAATSELYGLLPKGVRARVARKVTLPVNTEEPQILEEMLKIEEEIEREQESQVVEELEDAANNPEGRGVLGLAETLAALQEGRVWQLIYREDFAPRGSQCANCGALFSAGREACIYCDGELRTVDDLVERAAEQVLDMSGKIEQVRGAAAARLEESGGIGALLRF